VPERRAITYVAVFVVTLLTSWLYLAVFSESSRYEATPMGKGGQLVKTGVSLQEAFTRAFALALGLATLNTFFLWRWQSLCSLRHKTPSSPERPIVRENEHVT